ncbi:MAG: homoserine kinase [Alphaproteobacteria bacterium]
MAVYTEISDEDLARFVAGYDIGELVSFKGIAEGVENSNYILQTDRGTFILTLYEKRVAREDLPFFLSLMEHLAGNGIACPTPIHDRKGRALNELAGRPAAIITFLTGMWPRRITPDHCGELGQAMARMHLAGRGFTMSRPNSLSVSGWRPLFEPSRARAHEVHPDLAGEIETELSFLESHWPRNLPAGIIHADLFPDNVFFLGDKLSGLIDFYFACNDFFAYDLAICLNAWCFEKDRSFNVTKARQMLSRYRKVRPFSKDEFEALPLLARGGAMRFLLTRLYDWLHRQGGAVVRPKDPLEYRDKLRFHQSVTGPGAYGLE